MEDVEYHISFKAVIIIQKKRLKNKQFPTKFQQIL